MCKLNRGILYLSLHNQLKRNVGLNKRLGEREFFIIIGKHFLIPKRYKKMMINEMENIGLLKRVEGKELEVLECDIDIENDIDKFFIKE